MTRKDCMRKLLVHGGLTLRECVDITGWSVPVVRCTLQHLVAKGEVQHDGKWGGVYSL